MDSVFVVPANTIRFVLLPSDERKKLHQYLEQEYPALKKASAPCKKFGMERRKTLKKCYKCNKLVLLTYRHGQMENNQDEYYTGACAKCAKRIEWECNYDDYEDIVRIPILNKMFVFGDYNFPISKKPIVHPVQAIKISNIEKNPTREENLRG